MWWYRRAVWVGRRGIIVDVGVNFREGGEV